MLRRSFLALSAAAPFSAAVAQSRFALARTVAEWPFIASRPHAAPDELELDVVFRGPSGEHRVPAYWAGGSEWRVRFAAPAPGRYTYATLCSDPADTGLHARTGTFDAAPYNGANPLMLQGAPRVASDRRHFEHDDGTPFFWLGDTWWMGLCQRIQWPDDFQQLTADRAAKGFTVVQIVAGLYPDMPPSTRAARTKPAFLGKGLRAHQPRLFRHGRSPHPASGRAAAWSPASWAAGDTSCRGWASQNEAALALPDGALGRLSRGLVPGRRGRHALLPLHRQGTRRGETEARLDRTRPLRPRSGSLSPPDHHSPQPTARAVR